MPKVGKASGSFCAAQLSGLSHNHLREAIREGKLKGRIIGRGFKVKRSALDAQVPFVTRVTNLSWFKVKRSALDAYVRKRSASFNKLC
jgi:excisionase family DNA binding protein